MHKIKEIREKIVRQLKRSAGNAIPTQGQNGAIPDN
jgi:hypothetical protein